MHIYRIKIRGSDVFIAVDDIKAESFQAALDAANKLMESFQRLTIEALHVSSITRHYEK